MDRPRTSSSLPSKARTALLGQRGRFCWQRLVVWWKDTAAAVPGQQGSRKLAPVPARRPWMTERVKWSVSSPALAG